MHDKDRVSSSWRVEMDGGLERPFTCPDCAWLNAMCIKTRVRLIAAEIVWRRAGPVAPLELPDGDSLHRVYPVCLVNNPARRADHSIDVIRSRLQFHNAQ